MQFANPGTRKAVVWKMVAGDMNMVKGETSFTADICQKKWSNLVQTYKEKKDKKGKTGRGGGRGWTYFQELDDLLGESAAVESVSASVSKNSTGRFKVPPSRSASCLAATKLISIPTAPSLARPVIALTSTSQRSSASASCSRAVTPSAVTPSSVISPPSDDSDEDELDAAALNSVADSQTPRGTGLKRKRSSGRGWNQDFQEWAEKFSNESKARDDRLAARLDSLEDLERKRLAVLIEMKDLMKNWVDLAKERQNQADK